MTESKSPRVSVVVPAFRNEAYLAQTLNSVLAQTWTDFELIVADHSSDDGTADIARAYAEKDDRVRVSITPPGGGAAANWRAVTEQATGDLLKLVCGDDLIAPECLAIQVNAFERFPEALMVAAQRDILDSGGATVLRARGLQGLREPGKGPLVDGRTAIRKSVRAGTNVFGEPGAVLLRREAFLDAGSWDDRFPYLLDQASYARLLQGGPLVAVRRSLAAFRISDQQWSVALAKQQYQHAVDFHRSLAQEYPGLLSRADLVVGNSKAWSTARARRAVSWWYRRQSDQE